MTDEKSSVVARTTKDAAKDRSLADELREAVDVAGLHALSIKMINEREVLARGFNSTIAAWNLIDDKSAGSSDYAIAAVERVAAQAMQMAQEVIQVMSKK